MEKKKYILTSYNLNNFFRMCFQPVTNPRTSQMDLGDMENQDNEFKDDDLPYLVEDIEADDRHLGTKRPFAELETRENRQSTKRLKNDGSTRKDVPREDKRSQRDFDSTNVNNMNYISNKRQRANPHLGEGNWQYRQEHGANFDFDYGEEDEMFMYEQAHEPMVELSQNLPDYGFVNDLCDSDFDDDNLKPEF